jgi:hypothetical protein
VVLGVAARDAFLDRHRLDEAVGPRR